MKERKLVTLVLEYDPEIPDHPTEWDWQTLVGDEHVEVLRVEVYGT